MVLTPSQYNKLKKGDAAPGFSLQGTDEKTYTLDSFSGKKALLIVFMCNHCPYVKPKMDFLNQLQKTYAEQGLQVVGINANDPTDYPEDDFAHMQQVAQEKGFTFPYLVDETQGVARAYGASCTPDPFLFDAEQKLVYHGRIDDAHAESHEKASTNELEEAVQQLLVGEDIRVNEQPSLGCSIKWK